MKRELIALLFSLGAMEASHAAGVSCAALFSERPFAEVLEQLRTRVGVPSDFMGQPKLTIKGTQAMQEIVDTLNRSDLTRLLEVINKGDLENWRLSPRFLGREFVEKLQELSTERIKKLEAQTQPAEWPLTAELQAMIIKKIVDNAGEDKFFDAVDSGNNGLRAYVVPSSRYSKIVDTIQVIEPSSPYSKKIKELKFDPSIHRIVGVLATHDESIVSFLIFEKGKDQAHILAHKLNPIDVVDSEAIVKVLPEAMVDGYYEGFQVLYELLKDSQELPLPYKYNSKSGWSIEDFNLGKK